MCTVVLVAFFVAAVLAIPALASLIGTAALILLALAAIALAEPRRPTPVPQIDLPGLPTAGPPIARPLGLPLRSVDARRAATGHTASGRWPQSRPGSEARGGVRGGLFATG
jgi:hypothetical protein